MKLNEFFVENPKVAIAFSGGVDSAYLLYAAKQYAKEVKAYYVKSAFQPQFEFEDAERLSNELEVDMSIINLDVLSDNNITSNPVNRCYYCKRHIFKAIKENALADGFKVLLDGTNYSDDASDRPGMKALSELEVLSPLRICELTKDEIRRLSEKAGLFTANKPAYACLATRIPANDCITVEKLSAVELTESYLFKLGFRNFRVRRVGNSAKIQVIESQLEKIIEHRESIVSYLKKYYSDVMLDLEVRNENGD